MASQSALYVHAIAMLNERADVVAERLAERPADSQLLEEQAALRRSLRLFRNRLRRTELAIAVASQSSDAA